ncbi:MAG: 1-deoxy-D-xylulose-5-phosphate reductoisomerase [Propioniciclava sp.]|uniref:1-deoxy-D-xylulose-5-phosphate reductoisomerase n=1 Tax=Propioniciclava sp. TaxID=2038686 RepID=UPI0039E653C8
MRDVVILGSTGSIGTQALEVISTRGDQFNVVALTAGGANLELLAEQACRFRPRFVGVATDEAATELAAMLADTGIEVAGAGANERAAAMSCDVVLNGITGAAGLLATLTTLKAGTTLALANKESLVIGGRLVTDAAAPGQIVAVDSEHSALAQSLRAGRREEVRRLILTASGGPFRGRTRAELAGVTPEQALAHPTWTMGRVVTVNSATLVNKGLELIEAALLYGVDYDAITVVVHPTSDVHSMVEFTDGATIAQASPPDMRLPIALGLSWPDRVADVTPSYDWSTPRTWMFEPLDSEAFGAVELARRAGKAAGTAPAVFNAANEICVDAFCAGDLGFLGIVDTVEAVLNEHLAAGHVPDGSLTLEAVLAADAWARDRARQICGVA